MKTQLCFGNGVMDCFMDVESGNFYAYGASQGEIHKLFSGKQYYCSRSGLTGAGFILSDNIVEFGYYRTDCKDEQKLKLVGNNANSQEIMGYCPIDYGKHELVSNAPIVLTDGKRVAYCTWNEVREFLADWEKKWEEIKDTLAVKELKRDLYLPRKNHEYGDTYYIHDIRGLLFSSQYWDQYPNPYRFVDLREYREQISHENLAANSLACNSLGILKFGDYYYSSTGNGLIDGYYGKNNPVYEKDDDLKFNGWRRDQGLCWKRKGFNLSLIKEIERPEKYRITNNQFCDFEETVSIYHEYGLNQIGSETWLQYWHNHFDARLIHKMRQDWSSSTRNSVEEIKKLLEKYSSTTISVSIADSIAAGNCLVGSRDFIDRFALKESELIKNLLEHQSLDKMLKDFNFRKTILFALSSKED